MTLLGSINWPDVFAGALVAGAFGAVGFCFKSIILHSSAKRAIVRYGKGEWFSAEYDPKGNVPKEHRLTYLRVVMEPTWRGRVRVQSVEQLDQHPSKVETAWIAEGRIENGSLVGEWRTTVKGTVRFGTAMIRFLDNGRAVGYWIGVRGFDPPMYGYWIMSKSEDDLRAVIAGAVPPGSFQMIDVGRRVADFERGTRGSRV